MSTDDKKVRLSMSRDYDAVKNTVAFVMKEGEKVTHSLVCELAALPQPLYAYAAAAGIIQTVGDCAALPADKATGKPATMDQKFVAMTDRWNFLLTGEGWVKKPVQKTPEQKAAELETLVRRAFSAVSKADFEEYVKTALANTTAAGETTANRAAVIQAMRKAEKIAAWIRAEEEKLAPVGPKVALPKI